MCEAWCSAHKWAVRRPVGHARNRTALPWRQYMLCLMIRRIKCPCSCLFWMLCSISVNWWGLIHCILFLVYNSLWCADEFSLETAVCTWSVPPLAGMACTYSPVGGNVYGGSPAMGIHHSLLLPAQHSWGSNDMGQAVFREQWGKIPLMLRLVTLNG